LLREAEHRELIPERRPAHIPSLDEAEEFWRYRDATGLVHDAIEEIPDLAVIVVARATDHVQIAPDHPHIYTQVNAFCEAGAKFVRLNPDRAYVEWTLNQRRPQAPDNDAGLTYGPTTIGDALCPDDVTNGHLLTGAAICELVDRVQSDKFEANLDGVLYPDAPRMPPPPRRPGLRGGPRL
jgi:hypothetical protein